MRSPGLLVANQLMDESSEAGFFERSNCRDIAEQYIEEINADESLIEYLTVEAIQTLSKGHRTRLLTSQQFILGQNENIAVRLNLWPTLADRGEHTEAELDLYSYHAYHDHNFNFITIGHYGPGYYTDIYTYDRDKVRGDVGEKVELTFQANQKLSRGKKLWFDSGKHIHSQSPPDELSSSINILFKEPKEQAKPQFYFDIENHTIKSISDNAVSKQMNFLNLCSLFDNDLCRELIDFYAEDSAEPILRNLAKELVKTRS